MKQNGIWLVELERFGYTLTAVGKTEDEVKKSIRDEYIKTYAKWNELDEGTLRLATEFDIAEEDGTVDQFNPYNEFANDYVMAMEEAVPEFIAFGKVEWR